MMLVDSCLYSTETCQLVPGRLMVDGMDPESIQFFFPDRTAGISCDSLAALLQLAVAAATGMRNRIPRVNEAGSFETKKKSK